MGSASAVLILCLLVSAILSSRSYSEEVYTGKLFVTGAEPFAQVAIEVAGGNTFVLGWAKDYKDLLKEQGKMAKVVGEEMPPQAVGALRVLKPSSITTLNIEADIVSIEVQVQKDPVTKKPGWATEIKPHAMGKWYVGRNDAAISTGRVGNLAAGLEEVRMANSSPDMASMVKQPFTDVVIRHMDGAIDRLRSGVVKNSSIIWRMNMSDGHSKVVTSSAFTKAFVELMKEADPENWASIAEAYLSQEKKP